MNGWSEADLAYMAGIIDGEGSICIFPTYGKTRGYGPYARPRPVISVCNTSEDLIAWIVNRFGGAGWRVSRARNVDSHKWKPTFMWQVGHEKAAAILRAILPYLVIKRRQAELFLECQATMKRRGSNRTPPEVLILRTAIMTEISELNRRGTPLPAAA